MTSDTTGLVLEDIGVDSEMGCPECGETRVDYLIWDDESEYVKCDSCGCCYVP